MFSNLFMIVDKGSAFINHHAIGISSLWWVWKCTFKCFWKYQSYLIYFFFVNTEKWSEIFSKDEKEKGINILFLVFVHFQECVSVV